MVRPPSGGTAAGRGMGTKMKTADTKSMSSQQWIKRQLSDKWSERARAEGWRSRAAFKLLEIDDRFHLIKHGCRVIDLGAAPGGWAQVAVKRGAISVVGVDLLPVEPVPGAIMIQADFTHPGVDQQMMDLLGGAPDPRSALVMRPSPCRARIILRSVSSRATAETVFTDALLRRFCDFTAFIRRKEQEPAVKPPLDCRPKRGRRRSARPV